MFLNLSLFNTVYGENYGLLWRYETGNWVCSVVITPDGRYIVAGSRDNHVYLFNTQGELLWRYRTGDDVYSVDITPDGKYIVAGSDSIYLFNTQGELLWSYNIGSNVNSVDITSHGRYIVAGCSKGNIYFFVHSQLIWKVLEDARKTIWQIKAKYNIKEAESLFIQAEAAFKRGDYYKAVELALKAKEKAVEINKQAEKAEKAIEDARSTILKVKPRYNVKEAKSLLAQAEAAFKRGDYYKAEELALKAKSFAIDIDQDGVPNEKDSTPYTNDYFFYIPGIVIFLTLLYLGKRYYNYRKRLEEEKQEIIKELKKIIR